MSIHDMTDAREERMGVPPQRSAPMPILPHDETRVKGQPVMDDPLGSPFSLDGPDAIQELWVHRHSQGGLTGTLPPNEEEARLWYIVCSHSQECERRVIASIYAKKPVCIALNSLERWTVKQVEDLILGEENLDIVGWYLWDEQGEVYRRRIR